jgi:hypothetical protein
MKADRNDFERSQGQALLTPLHIADVAPVNPECNGHRQLRHAMAAAQIAQARSKTRADICGGTAALFSGSSLRQRIETSQRQQHAPGLSG